jgi:hypothetical protein
LNLLEAGDDCVTIPGEELLVEVILSAAGPTAFCGELLLKLEKFIGNT